MNDATKILNGIKGAVAGDTSNVSKFIVAACDDLAPEIEKLAKENEAFRAALQTAHVGFGNIKNRTPCEAMGAKHLAANCSRCSAEASQTEIGKALGGQ